MWVWDNMSLQTSKETMYIIGADINIKNAHICYKTTIQTSVCGKDCWTLAEILKFYTRKTFHTNVAVT